MSFLLTRDAEADVIDIYRYSVENFGETQADTYHDGLSDCFRLLADTPLIGRDYGFLRLGLRRYEHVSHSVYYRLTTPASSSCASCIGAWTQHGIYEADLEQNWPECFTGL